MASGLQSYTATFSGDFTSFIAGKVINAAKNAKQEKENQKKAQELGIEVPAEEKKGLFKRALGYEFGGRRFDRTVGPFLKSKTSAEVSNKSKFSDQFSYTKLLKKGNKTKPPTSPISTTGRTTTKKGSGRFNFTKGFGQIALELEILNNKVSALTSIANKQLGATYRTSGGLAGIQKILLEQNNIQREAKEDAKSQQEEASMDAIKDTSASDVYKSTFDQTPGWNDETGQPEPIAPAGGGPGVPEGESGGGGLGSLLDIADTALDLGKTVRGLGKRGGGRALTRAGAAVGGKKGARAASKAGGIGSKFFGKALGKSAGKGVAKAAGKGIAKGVGKSLVKKIPIIGAIAGIGFGIQRAMEGDWLGAAGEMASGIASTVPGAGTAVSAGIDAALVGKDVASASPQPQAEGGVMPLSSAISKTVLPSLIPGAAMSAGMTTNDSTSGAVEEAAKMPFKAVGGAILAVTSGFIKALGPVAGLVAPMIKQETAPLARLLGMPSSLVKFGGIGGATLQPSSAAQKEGMNFLKNFMDSALEKLGIKPKKEESKSSGGGGGGGSPASTPPPPASDDAGDTGGGGGGAPAPEPGKRFMTADEYAGKITKEVRGEVVGQTNARASAQNIFGVKDKRLSRVKNSENQSETAYYHDTFGQLYKLGEDNKTIVRVPQSEITAGSGDWATGKWDFYRKPDKNVVLGRLESMPVGSIKLANRQIVYEAQESERAGKVKKLREPTEEERKRHGIDQIKSPFGAASSAVPQIQAASGVSVLSKLGDSSKLATAGEGYCVTGVLKTMEKNGVPNPPGTGNDPNNPRGLAVQLMKSYGWGSISGLGSKINLKSPYGNVGANAMSFGQWKQAVKSNKIPSGSLVFTTRNSDWSGNQSSGHDAAIAKQGGRKLWSGLWQAQVDGVGAVYGAASNKIIALTPGGQQISYDGSAASDDGGTEENGGEAAEPVDPMQALQQSVAAALSGAAKLRGLAEGKKWEDIKAEPDKSWEDWFGPAEPSTTATPTTTKPSTNKPDVKPGATSPQATAPPAKPSRPPVAAPSLVSAAPSSFVPLPMGGNTPGGGGSYHVRATDIGTAENLRPQLASYIG